MRQLIYRKTETGKTPQQNRRNAEAKPNNNSLCFCYCCSGASSAASFIRSSIIVFYLLFPLEMISSGSGSYKYLCVSCSWCKSCVYDGFQFSRQLIVLINRRRSSSRKNTKFIASSVQSFGPNRDQEDPLMDVNSL